MYQGKHESKKGSAFDDWRGGEQGYQTNVDAKSDVRTQKKRQRSIYRNEGKRPKYGGAVESPSLILLYNIQFHQKEPHE